MDSRKHQCATLLIQALMQTMDRFDASNIDQRYAAHGEYQRVRVFQVLECFIELARRSEEKRTCEERDSHMLAFALGLDASLFEAFRRPLPGRRYQYWRSC